MSKTPNYSRAYEFSERKLAQLRAALAAIVPSDSVAITCGSFARRDASPLSDLDFFIVSKGRPLGAMSPTWVESAHRAIQKVIPNAPAEGGAFAQHINRDSLLRNFGGSKDSNATITRRMLYLLEGEWLTNETEFRDIRRRIIQRYVNETPRSHQLAFYLLNDVIRYWRTITVDYSEKTGGENGEKPWAIRNVKLVFSRKLLYASGLFSVAMTVDRQQAEKVEILQALFDLPVLERMDQICGADQMRRLSLGYDYFLGEMEKGDVRERLRSLSRDQRDSDPVFRSLKDEAHHFSRELMRLYSSTFVPSHPIHMAVVF